MWRSSSAWSARSGIKTSNNSARLGGGAIGALSLPFAGRDDAMVKVASQTLTDERFYDRFFALLDRFLEGPEDEADAPQEEKPEKPAAAPLPAEGPATTYPVNSSPNRG